MSSLREVSQGCSRPWSSSVQLMGHAIDNRKSVLGTSMIVDIFFPFSSGEPMVAFHSSGTCLFETDNWPFRSGTDVIFSHFFCFLQDVRNIRTWTPQFCCFLQPTAQIFLSFVSVSTIMTTRWFYPTFAMLLSCHFSPFFAVEEFCILIGCHAHGLLIYISTVLKMQLTLLCASEGRHAVRSALCLHLPVVEIWKLCDN